VLIMCVCVSVSVFVCVMGLKDIGMMCYGWRADGDVTWESE